MAQTLSAMPLITLFDISKVNFINIDLIDIAYVVLELISISIA